jgi:hypothetical protein
MAQTYAVEATPYTLKSIDQVKQPRQAWIYNAGQRRVRRAPNLAYDNVADGTEAMRVTDQYDAYNGAPDRYEWKLVGKKEMYVPYNAYKLSDKKLKYADIIQKNTIASNYLLSTLDNELKTPWKFGINGNWSDFQPDPLRRQDGGGWRTWRARSPTPPAACASRSAATINGARNAFDLN